MDLMFITDLLDTDGNMPRNCSIILSVSIFSQWFG